ncbi:hypothetical protein ACFE04_002058 [Oxalis oulophora]
MASSEVSLSDMPLTPAGRLFVHPQMNTVITCVLGSDIPIHLDVDVLKTYIGNSNLVKHPRFCSILVRDKNGVEHWRKSHVDIDRHVIAVQNTEEGFTVNDYLSDLSVSSPLELDKPLWELHVLNDHNAVIFRVHHALGDGMSLMSLLLANCRKVKDPMAVPELPAASGERSLKSLGKGGVGILWALMKMVVLSLVYMYDFLVRALWVSDKETAIRGGAGVELWPRKMATARFWLEDMKIVKRAVAGATINDVLFGIITSGLSRYLDHRTPNALKEGLRLTGVAMVNLREHQVQDLNELIKNNRTPQGNQFGMILLPIYFHKAGNDPLEYVRRAKVMIDRKKKSLEAYLTYVLGDFVMSWFGTKYASLLNYRVLCNTTFTISNVVGPQEKGLVMHMVSYDGKADMQIMVAKDIIPDPEFLAKCFEDGLLHMKEAALLAAKSL